METKEINTLIVFFTKVGNTISNLFMENAKDQLGHINVEELEGGNAGLKYNGQLTPAQRDKFNAFCEEHDTACLYLEYDAEMEDKVSNVCVANYE